MSPNHSKVSDRKSEKARSRPGRPATSRAAMLDAALSVFAAAPSPESVTMDAVAAAVGVGKGTIFRAFGDRDGLLEALVTRQFDPLREAVTSGEGKFGADVAPAERIAAFLDAVLRFKVEHRSVMQAREGAAAGRNYDSDRYRWMHRTLRDWIDEAGPAEGLSSSYVAHALLVVLQIDSIDELLESGMSVDELVRHQAAHQGVLVKRSRRRRPTRT